MSMLSSQWLEIQLGKPKLQETVVHDRSWHYSFPTVHSIEVAYKLHTQQSLVLFLKFTPPILRLRWLDLLYPCMLHFVNETKIVLVHSLSFKSGTK